jgi:DNA-binding NarL/FixJ family response regulator
MRVRSTKDVRVAAFRVGTEELVVLSCSRDHALPDQRLTRSESEVVEAIRQGSSNADIARRRGTSTRTVANQVAGVFRKLGVHSRTELVRVLHSRSGYE